jgi:hypothetical protein
MIYMNNGLFDLTAFENANDTFIPNLLDEPMTEGEQEFEVKDDGNNPTVPFDKDNSGEHGPTIPAGKTAKPEGGEQGPNIPADKAAKNYDDASISVPNKVTLTASQYNAALEQLQKSFDEGAKIAQMLTKVKVVDEETATAEEVKAMNILTEMATTKPRQFGAWLTQFTESAE